MPPVKNFIIILTGSLIYFVGVDSFTLTDYLQIFRLKKKEGKVIIEHEQEVPPYKEQYNLQQSHVSIEHDIKIYVIDSIDYSTMILAEEY